MKEEAAAMWADAETIRGLAKEILLLLRARTFELYKEMQDLDSACCFKANKVNI